MSESGMRQRTVKALKLLDAISVENPAYPGTPDINFIGGWIECKWLRSWPLSDKTIVKIGHYTNQQKVWARRRIRRGGNVWFMLQCGKEWLLIKGDVAAKQVGSCTRKELIQISAKSWLTGLKDQELLEFIKCNRSTTNL